MDRPAPDRVAIEDARTPADLDAIRLLFREYQDGVGAPDCFEGFAAELAGLPGDYGPPGGALLVARVAGTPAGCAALRPLGGRAGELKRLYVRSPYRTLGLGRRLVLHMVARSREAGHRVLRLDTLPGMTEARRLYQHLGFRRIAPYSDTPGALHFELTIAP